MCIRDSGESPELGYDDHDGADVSIGIQLLHELARDGGVAGKTNYALYQYRYEFCTFFV